MNCKHTICKPRDPSLPHLGASVTVTSVPLTATCAGSHASDECHALGLTRWAGENLHKLLTAPENAAWASKAVKEARLGSLQALRAECELPGVSIVVVGNTGAGKSTLLNALLDETRVLPTNGMRACTASLIEMRHEASDPARDPLYRGEVEFLTQAEWDKYAISFTITVGMAFGAVLGAAALHLNPIGTDTNDYTLAPVALLLLVALYAHDACIPPPGGWPDPTARPDHAAQGNHAMLSEPMLRGSATVKHGSTQEA